MTLGQLGLIEIKEAFAPGRAGPAAGNWCGPGRGGPIALGHPLDATGAGC
jgi:acetyl-CoA acetyltransferase